MADLDHEPYHNEADVLQTRENDNREESEVDIISCRPCEGSISSRLQVLLPRSNFQLDIMTSHKHGLAAHYIFKMAVSKVEFWASFETFFRIAGTLEAENSVSGKTKCLLVIGGNNKVSFLVRPFPLNLSPIFVPRARPWPWP